METQATLLMLINGYRNTALVYSAVKLGLIDLMGDGDWTPDAMAQQTGCDPDSVQRLLQALCVIGICEPTTGGGYGLTATGKLLRSDASSPMATKVMLAVEQYADSWMRLPHCIRTGSPSFPEVHGQDVWQWRRERPEADKLFGEWLSRETGQSARAIVDAYPFAPGSIVADIGGGEGALLSALLSTRSDCTGILFEQTGPILSAEAKLGQDPALTGRLRLVEGDFFRDMDVTADVFVLKSVLHDWDDARCLAILRNIRRALRPRDTLLLVERMLDAPNGSGAKTTLLDIHMMVMHGGRERSLESYRTLLRQAGLEEMALFPAASGHLVIEAKAA